MATENMNKLNRLVDDFTGAMQQFADEAARDGDYGQGGRALIVARVVQSAAYGVYVKPGAEPTPAAETTKEKKTRKPRKPKADAKPSERMPFDPPPKTNGSHLPATPAATEAE